MRPIRSIVILAAVAGFVVAARPFAAAPPQSTASPTYAQFLGAASPVEVVSAKKAERVAWVAHEQGKRNVYTASAPLFAPVRLTSFLKDDGVDLTDVAISDDGSTVAFVRGTEPNRSGWDANPSGNPDGPDLSIWAARTANPGVAWRVSATPPPNTPFELAPDGSSIVFGNDGQIYHAKISPVRPESAMDRGEAPFIKEWGVNSGPKWSPDGKKIAFATVREDHGYIGVYDVATRAVTYMSPGVDHDTTPIWSADSKHITFFRRPGTPFGLVGPQTQSGIGVRDVGGAQGGRAGRGGGGAAAAGAAAQGQQAGAGTITGTDKARSVPGLMSSTFKGGYTFSIWTADVATAEAHEVWHPAADERIANNLNQVRWAGDDTLIFAGGGRGGGGRGARGGGGAAGPVDEWERYYSLTFTAPNAKPVLLTTTDGLIEDATSVAVSSDGRTFFYCTNAKDIERRHIWAVPSTGGTPVQVTTGTGIETYPAPLASGKSVATLSATWNMPMSLGVWSVADNKQKIVIPTSRPGFPMDAHVEPQLILTKAADGLEIHNQLFLPKDIKPGEKHPAIVFVHGGPVRQMLLGYHYRYVYHMFYGINEWLASKGYVVLSINYRSGIGYGHTFASTATTEARGNSEYQDVIAGAQYLQSRPDVDAKHIGIYGLSYGGLLTAQALARNSDIFAAGVDYAGVHLYGSSLNPNDLSYQSSAISQVDNWKSPVLLIQGDDDRNVAFQQTTGLVQLLRQRDVYYELVVFPDDVHDSLMYSRWMYLLGRMDVFVTKFLGKTG